MALIPWALRAPADLNVANAATLYFATLCHTLSVKHLGIRLEVLTLYVEAQAGDQQYPSGLWSDTLHHILDGLST